MNWRGACSRNSSKSGRNYLGDFYPLTDYSLENEVWLAWQYDRPEAGEGLVQAFRRPQSADSIRVFRLRGLEPTASTKSPTSTGQLPRQSPARNSCRKA